MIAFDHPCILDHTWVLIVFYFTIPFYLKESIFLEKVLSSNVSPKCSLTEFDYWLQQIVLITLDPSINNFIINRKFKLKYNRTVAIELSHKRLKLIFENGWSS